MDEYRDEEAAAELTAALSAELPQGRERMRAALTARVVADGESMVRLARTDRVRPGRVRPGRPVDMWRWTGWMAAAAAVLLWISGPGVRDDRNAPGGVSASIAAAATLAELRASVLRADSTATPLRWAATSDSTAHGATGDVVWSDRLQRGVLRIAGLQPNDRQRWQYQLWIFDKTRDEKYPVDGGVFDMPSTGGEVLIPIAARLRVGNATVFAVTVERAGGVVVSERERIALLAQRGG